MYLLQLLLSGGDDAQHLVPVGSGGHCHGSSLTASHPSHHTGVCSEPLPRGICAPLELNQLLLPQPVPPSPSQPPLSTQILPSKCLCAGGQCHQGSQEHEDLHCQPEEPVLSPSSTTGLLNPMGMVAPARPRQLSLFPGQVKPPLPREGSGWHQPRSGTAAPLFPPPQHSQSQPDLFWEVAESPVGRVRRGGGARIPPHRLQHMALGWKRVNLG